MQMVQYIFIKEICLLFLLMDIFMSFGENLYVNCHSRVT